MTPEERLAIEARVQMAQEMSEPDAFGLLEWYCKDVPGLLELVRDHEQQMEFRDQHIGILGKRVQELEAQLVARAAGHDSYLKP